MAVLGREEEVRITGGPYRGFRGRIEAVHSEQARVTVVVVVFGRQTRLQLDASQVERL